jgi:hypothetical protein
MAKTVIFETKRKIELLTQRIDCKVYENCGSKFDKIESNLMKILREDLLFLGTPSHFARPEGLGETETGIGALVKALRQTAKPTPRSPIKSRATTPVNIQYLEEASHSNFGDGVLDCLGSKKYTSIIRSQVENPYVCTKSQVHLSDLDQERVEFEKYTAAPSIPSPTQTANFLSNPTPIEIRELSLSVPEQESF